MTPTHDKATARPWKHETYQRDDGSWIVRGPGGNFGPFGSYEEANLYAADLNLTFNGLTNDLIGLKNARHDDAQRLSELHAQHDALKAENERLRGALEVAIAIVEGNPPMDPFKFPEYARAVLGGGK